MKVIKIAATTATLALAGGTALADTGAWYVHAGPAQLTLANKATIRIAGAVAPGATYTSDAQYTSVVEIGYMLQDHWGVSLTAGLPPEAKAMGAGTINGIGRLGSATYGPSAITGHYHFNVKGKFQPYVGVGGSYMHVFHTKDGVLGGLKINDAIGPAVQAGAEYRFSPHWGAFFDYKKAWLRTTADGSIGGAPVLAKMVFDPTVLNAGVAFHF